jgi:hypothetical protein
MAFIYIGRIIRDSCLEKYSTYKVDPNNVSKDDTIRITISLASDHSSKLVFEISGQELNGNGSLDFTPIKTQNGLKVKWLGKVKPNQISNGRKDRSRKII